MARKTKEEKEKLKQAALRKAEALKKKKKVRDEITAVIIIAVGLFLIISMFTSTTGAVGAAVKSFFAGLLGWASYILPFFLLIYGILVFAQKTSLVTAGSITAIIILLVLLTCFVANLKAPLKDAVKYDFSYSIKEIYTMGTDSGGIVGVFAGGFIKNLIGEMGLYLVCAAGVIIALLLILNTPLSTLFDNFRIKRKAHKMAKEAAMAEREELEAIAAEREHEVRKLQEQQALKEAREEEEARAKRLAKQAQLAEENNRQQKVDTDKLPKLDMKAIEDFHGNTEEDKAQTEEFIQKYEEIAPSDEKPAAPRFTPEDIGLKSPDKPAIRFEGDNITQNQQKVLETWIGEDLTGKAETKITDAAVASINEINTDKSDEIKNPRKRSAAHKTDSNNTEAQNTGDSSDLKDNEAKNTGTQIDVPASSYIFPPVDLLSEPGSTSGSNSGQNLAEQTQLLEDTLSSFGVSAKVVDVVKGPAVTRFEVQPATGVKVSKIAALHDDLALNLRAKSLRIEAPIPGKAAVGIEVSNDQISTITLREIIESEEFKNSKSKITVSLGRSIDGAAIVTDLKSMPHLLVAGSTGSGKSVCINSMLISLLYKSTPEEVQMILIDPKVVELSIYNGIPHLMIPVVTDAAKASAALGWAVSEMDNRYKKFADEGVRDLKSYNETAIANGENDKVLPQIIIVIDELAELIMTAKSTVEDSICRLAQKARAAGMHLIVATQRPSTDVITGVIKANIPSRIAFAVSSLTDSRVILDVGGAEHLLGKGDMLYSPQNFSKPLRVQGCFVSDNEVRDVIEFIKKQGEMANYNEDILHAMSNAGINNASSSEGNSEEDELLKDAIETVVRAEQCSVSMLQRRFRIGYNRAARLVDLMEERGIVGPPEGGARARKVNMSIAEFQALQEQAAGTDSEGDYN